MRLAVVALASPALAQDPLGAAPSDCRGGASANETAICASPDLLQLERRMVAAYRVLVQSVGEPEAQRLAARYQERRQACDGEPACIAERLRISTEVFRQRSGAPLEAIDAPPPAAQETARAEPQAGPVPSPPARPGLEAVPVPPSREVREAEAPPQALAAAPDLAPAVPRPDPAPSAARAEPPPPEPPDLAALEPAAPDRAPDSAAATAPAPPELAGAVDGAQLASSDNAPAPSVEAPFDTPLSWAFMDFPREERAALQARLREAGLHDGPAGGAWDTATLAALQAVASRVEGYDVATQGGAADLLDYVASEAFEADFMAGPTTDTAKAPD